MPNETTMSTQGKMSQLNSRSLSSSNAASAKDPTSTTQHQGRSEQMQRWLDTPRRHEPYVAGHGTAKHFAEVQADVGQALRVLHQGSGDGKL